MYYMLPASKSIKQTAKGLMEGKWPQLLGVSCITMCGFLVPVVAQSILQTAFGAVQTLSGAIAQQNLRSLSPAALLTAFIGVLLTLCLWSPLCLGVQRWFWRLSGGADDTVGGLFHYFSSGRLYGRALLFQILLFFRLLLTALAAFAPAIISYLLVSPEFYTAIGAQTPVIVTELWSLPGAFAALGLIAFIPWALRYYLASYLLINDPALTPGQALTLSVKASRGSRAAFLGLLLTFFGWLLLCLLALPAFFVLPYISAARAVFARYAIHAYNTGLQRAPTYGMY